MNTEIKGDAIQSHIGFDAAVRRREDDYLNRWPFAREIYQIAVTDPPSGRFESESTGNGALAKHWYSNPSLRWPRKTITLLLNSIHGSTLRKNPYGAPLVLTIFGKLESTFGSVQGADEARAKAWMAKAKGVVTAVAGVVHEGIGKAIGASLDLVKEHFAFTSNDLATLRGILGKKRIVILIDDLDRTAPEART